MSDIRSSCDNTKLLAAIGAHADALFHQDRPNSCLAGPHFITRRAGDTCWSLIVRLNGQRVSASTGTRDEHQARAIAVAIQADADAGHFTPTTAQADARVSALLAMMNRCAKPRQMTPSSENAAEDGQPDVRIAGS